MQPRMCVMLLAALAVSAQERQVGQGVNFYSRDKEASLGAQLAQEVRQRTTPLHTTTVLAISWSGLAIGLTQSHLTSL